jgi:aminobenzoyl-glutamate utilization protein B
MGGVRGPIDRTIATAGKAISGTLIDLFESPTNLMKCKDEWNDRVKTDYEPPLLDPALDPPIDLPWPEYVTTERGYDWHIPTPGTGMK